MRAENLPADLASLQFGFSKKSDSTKYLTRISMEFRKSKERHFATWALSAQEQKAWEEKNRYHPRSDPEVLQAK